VNATGNLAGSRTDIHKVKISMAFPRARVTQKKKVAEVLKDVAGGYDLNAQWRAAYALCVVEARSREDEFKKLRLEPPEVTCIKSTDTFYPRGNGITNSMLTGRRYVLPDEKVNRYEIPDERLKQKLDEQRPEMRKGRQRTGELSGVEN